MKATVLLTIVAALGVYASPFPQEGTALNVPRGTKLSEREPAVSVISGEEDEDSSLSVPQTGDNPGQASAPPPPGFNPPAPQPGTNPGQVPPPPASGLPPQQAPQPAGGSCD